MLVRILLVISVLMLIPVGNDVMVLHKYKSEAEKVEPGQAIGAEKAGLKAIMFFDYSCQFCKEAYPIAKEAAELDRDVKFIVKPIDGMDDQSGKLGRLSYAAGLQGKFIEVHEIFIEKSGELALDGTDLQEIASSAGIDYDRWVKDSESDDIKKAIAINTIVAGWYTQRVMPELEGRMMLPSFVIGNIFYSPKDRMPEPADFIKMFSEARGEAVE